MSCAVGFYLSAARQCIKCSQGCWECSGAAECSNCFSGYQNNSGTCSPVMDSTLKVVIVLLAAAVACLLVMVLIMYVGRKCIKFRQDEREIQPGAVSQQELADSGKWDAREGEGGIEQDGAVCAVCLEAGMNVLTRCGHSFHAGCLGEWFKRNVSCPVCKNRHIVLLRVYCQACRSCFSDYSFSGNFCELIRAKYDCKDCQPDGEVNQS